MAAAVRIRWWGTVAQVGNCTPVKSNPARCDVHVNPETGTDPAARAKAAGYRKRGTSWAVAENAYLGWGRPSVTPGAVTGGWAASARPGYTEMHTRSAYGSADPSVSGHPGRDPRADVRPVQRG